MLRVLFFIVYLLSLIYTVENGSCFTASCNYKGQLGCRNLMRNLAITQDDCCYGNGYGFYFSTENIGKGCYECDLCSEYLGRIDGGWSDWTIWTPCDKTCGGGIRKRSRLCNNPEPSKLGKDCEGSTENIEECNTLFCPVDGHWSKWTEWSDCSVTCGHGRNSRRRSCNNPRQQHGGKECSGRESETRECRLNQCPVDGAWSRWSPWSDCSQSCGGGEKSRNRRCNNPIPKYGGKNCDGRDTENDVCNEHPCPVHGSWSKWTEWSDCSVTCGRGRKTRQRKCDNPSPKHGGKHCPGLEVENESCLPRYCPINGGWAKWSGWSECSQTCGGGELIRTRKCTNPTPKHGGKMCAGNDAETKPCNEEPCPVHGQWGAWSEWSNCIAVDCKKLHKGGVKAKTRLCDDPAPMYGGKMCKGLFVEKAYCNENPDNCPVNGGWSDWSEWNCSCEIGVFRSRKCNSPEPRMGGKNCAENDFDMKATDDDIYMKYCFDDCKKITENPVTEDTSDYASGSGSGEIPDQETEAPGNEYDENYGE